MNGETAFSKKKYSIAVILSGIFGIVGIHHFYVERWWMGLFDFGLFVTTIVFFIIDYELIALFLFVIDLIHTVVVTYLLLTGQYSDGNGKIIPYPNLK